MLALLLLCCPTHHVLTDHVDVCELNHIVTPSGQSTYWVWWRLHEHEGHTDYYVADWRRKCDVPRPTNGVQVFWDSGAKVTRRVISRVQDETWSTFDREVFDRKRLPPERRRRLRSGS